LRPLHQVGGLEIEFPFGIIGKLIDPIAQRMAEVTFSKIQLKLKALAED
jgi:hypothetical protein